MIEPAPAHGSGGRKHMKRAAAELESVPRVPLLQAKTAHYFLGVGLVAPGAVLPPGAMLPVPAPVEAVLCTKPLSQPAWNSDCDNFLSPLVSSALKSVT
jgi:hypothetical protein